MAVSLERVQQWVKAWAADENPEVGVQVLDSHTDPQGHGVVIPSERRPRSRLALPNPVRHGNP
jgi:hypothetical protein